MSYLNSTLMENEKVLYHSKPHWIVFSTAVFLLGLTLVILVLGPQYEIGKIKFAGLPPFYILFSIITFVTTIYSSLSAVITFSASEFGITNKRVLMKTGFIQRASLEILLQKIEGIRVSQSILGRVLGYGTIIIIGTGGSKDFFNNVDGPLIFRKKVQEQIEKITGIE